MNTSKTFTRTSEAEGESKVPAVFVYGIEERRATPSLVADLQQVGKGVVGGHPQFPIAEQNVWVYVIPTLGSENISVVWNAHDLAGRTEEWVDDRSAALAVPVREVLLRHGFSNNTEVCVDGDLLPHDAKTGFAGPATQ